MLLTVGTTEAVEAIAEAQENLQEVAKNPGILRTYFQNLVPDLLNFALQVVIAVIVYAVGAKLIGLIVKIVRKTMERRNADVGVIQFLSAVVKYALYFILILTILSLFGIATTSAVAVLGSCGVAVGLALQGSLSNFAGGGPLLFVSHDRYFINRFATRVWELEEQRITDYPMGFARYRKIKAEQSAKKAEPEKAVKEKSLTEKPQRGNKNQQAARRQLTICEREIAQQEEALAALDARLEEAASDYEKYSALYTEKEAQEQKLTELMERWEALAAEAGG